MSTKVLRHRLNGDIFAYTDALASHSNDYEIVNYEDTRKDAVIEVEAKPDAKPEPKKKPPKPRDTRPQPSVINGDTDMDLVRVEPVVQEVEAEVEAEVESEPANKIEPELVAAPVFAPIQIADTEELLANLT